MARAAALLTALLLAGPAVAQGLPQVLSARFDEPTTRYDHGVLGDAVEWGALRITARTGGTTAEYTIRLPETRVFEDVAPRLADLDGDGNPEVLVVETDLGRGARLSAWRIGGETLVAATPYIGQAHRWLAPLGAADLDGDGHVEVAYVDRPHLARVLRVWRFRDGAFQEVAQAAGLTNHKIGWDHIPGGLRNCGQGWEMITADGAWRQVMASRLEGERIVTRALGPYSAEAMAQAVSCR
ncbi:FG-GAP repeat domain-containing protein [Pseudooceanicola sp. LIPI14-2-Ac024]|uniref:FG-GAP repeat domain-containing protein n=1 Tax=Pseudooceanicola sp. LIPI14-2-Ac024 TaxID=3344875 RepID=UPI0035CF9D52